MSAGAGWPGGKPNVPPESQAGHVRTPGLGWKLAQKLQLGASEAAFQKGQKGPVPCPLVDVTQGQQYPGRKSEEVWQEPGLARLFLTPSGREILP